MANLSYNAACTIVLMATLILLLVNDHSAESHQDYSLYDELIIPYGQLEDKDATMRYNIATDDNRFPRQYPNNELRRYLVGFNHGQQHQQFRHLKRSRIPVGFDINNMPKESKLVSPIDKRRFSYVWSPLTEQILPINDLSKFSMSYNDLLAQTEGYRAQQKLMDKSLASKSGRPKHDNADTTSFNDELNLDDSSMCRTIRAPVELTKDDVDKSDNNRVMRTCKGIVHINRCEGACVSLVQPSVKSRIGFRKKCSCCNEATFRRIQVRLNDCYVPGELESGDSKQQSTRSSSSAVSTPNSSYMDIELDEPIDCKCRLCDG